MPENLPGKVNQKLEGQKGKKLLTGVGVPGIVAGIVRNVEDSDPKLLALIEPGDIVIGVDLRPDELATYCKKAGALVTDRGGKTHYAAIFARETGKAAVIGTRNRNQNLKKRTACDCGRDKRGYIFSEARIKTKLLKITSYRLLSEC